jgi:hypothetical protein
MGPTAPEPCPAGPSRRSAFTRIQTRVAMHAIGVLPKDCQPQLSTRRSRRSLAWLRHPRIIRPQVTRPETGIPRHIQHDIQDAKGDGKGSSARLAQPRRLTGERDDTILSQNMRSKNERFARPQQ